MRMRRRQKIGNHSPSRSTSPPEKKVVCEKGGCPADEKKFEREKGEEDSTHHPIDAATITTSSTARKSSSINQLPDEVLVRVFWALPWRDRVRGVEGVCRRWHRLMLPPTRSGSGGGGGGGWADVRHLRLDKWRWWESSFRSSPQRWQPPFLSRVGPSLQSLAMSGSGGGGEVETEVSSVAGSSTSCNPPPHLPQVLLGEQLEKCPKLRHLSLRGSRLDRNVLAQIRRSYAGQLKSLRLQDCFYCDTAAQQPTTARVANSSNDGDGDGGNLLVEGEEKGTSFLRSFTALESLVLEDSTWVERDSMWRGEGLIGISHFAPLSLANLRQLSLIYTWAPKGVKNLELDVLATCSQLRSLKLATMKHTIKDFSFLEQLPQLNYLGITLSPVDVKSFCQTLAHAGSNLRALEIMLHWWTKVVPTMKYLVPAITTHSPLLEHLSVGEMRLGMEESAEAMHWLGKLTSSQTPRLTSLHFSMLIPSHSSWTWCEGMGQLEYLALDITPPCTAICNIIKGCKSLRSIVLPNYQPSPEDCEALFEAASVPSSSDAAERTRREGGKDPSTTNAPMPTTSTPLVMGIQWLRNSEGKSTKMVATSDGLSHEDIRDWSSSIITNNSKDRGSSRLRFADAEEVPSHVSDRHEYGCLSEGKPVFLT